MAAPVTSMVYFNCFHTYPVTVTNRTLAPRQMLAQKKKLIAFDSAALLTKTITLIIVEVKQRSYGPLY